MVLRYFCFMATLYCKYRVPERLLISYLFSLYGILGDSYKITHHTRVSYCFGFQLVGSAFHNISIKLDFVSLSLTFFMLLL